VLPLAFGGAGLPVHPALRAALSAATGRNGYGPVAGLPELRAAAAGYWDRRGLPTSPDAVVCGPGSKPLIFGLLLAIGADIAVPKPSWVSYAAQVEPDRHPGPLRPVPARGGQDLRSRPPRRSRQRSGAGR
jgi:aspartate/methionine/tyrosine aminotransferase